MSDAEQAMLALMRANEEQRLRIVALLTALDEAEEYFYNRADADCDQDGFIPNKEMQMLSVVRAAIAAAKGDAQ